MSNNLNRFLTHHDARFREFVKILMNSPERYWLQEVRVEEGSIEFFFDLAAILEEHEKYKIQYSYAMNVWFIWLTDFEGLIHIRTSIYPGNIKEYTFADNPTKVFWDGNLNPLAEELYNHIKKYFRLYEKCLDHLK